MNNIQRECLLDNRLYLADVVRLDSYALSTLFKKEIFRFGEYDLARHMGDDGRFCLLLDDCLPSLGPVAYDTFCVALACNELSRAAAKLKIGELRKHLEEYRDEVNPLDVCDNLLRVRYIDLCKAELKGRPRQTIDMTTRQLNAIIGDIKREAAPFGVPEKNPMLRYLEMQMIRLMTHD